MAQTGGYSGRSLRRKLGGATSLIWGGKWNSKISLGTDPNIDIGEVYFDRMRDRGEKFFNIEPTSVE